MTYRILADAVMTLHFLFVVFVVAGALLVLWRPALAWLHVPCALYGAAIEFFGWICPLTPLEVDFRRRAGAQGYEGGFVQHYLGDILYPVNLPDVQLWLGAGVLLLNGALYGWIILRKRGA